MATKVIIKQFKNKAKKPVAGLTPEHAIYDKNGVRLDAKLGNVNLQEFRDLQQQGVNAIKSQETLSVQAVADREAEILAKSDASKISSNTKGLEGNNVQANLNDVSNKITDINTQIIEISVGDYFYEYTENKIDILAERTNANFKGIVVACREGDTFIIKGNGGSAIYLYAFIDKDWKPIAGNNSGTSANITSETVITAGVGAKWLVANFNIISPYILKDNRSLKNIEANRDLFLLKSQIKMYKNGGVLNLNLLNNREGEEGETIIYDSETEARDSVPSYLRCKGLNILYQTSNGWKQERYIGNYPKSTTWSSDNYWTTINTKYTTIIAASDSSFKSNADVICTGTHDQLLINLALDKGNVLLLSGTYNISDPIVLSKSGTLLQGQYSSKIIATGTAIITSNNAQNVIVDGVDCGSANINLYSSGSGKIINCVYLNKRHNDFSITVKQFEGIDGINNAISALDINGGIIYLDEGTYSGDNAVRLIKNNIVIIGKGRSTTISRNMGYNDIFCNTENVRGCIIRDLNIAHSVQHRASAITLTEDFRLEDCYIAGQPYTSDNPTEISVGNGKQFALLSEALSFVTTAQLKNKSQHFEIHIYGDIVETSYIGIDLYNTNIIGHNAKITMHGNGQVCANFYGGGYKIKDIHFFKTGCYLGYQDAAANVFSDDVIFEDCIFENASFSIKAFDQKDYVVSAEEVAGCRRHGILVNCTKYGSACKTIFKNCIAKGSPFAYQNTRGWYLVTGAPKLYNCIGYGGGIGEFGHGIQNHRTSQAELFNCIGYAGEHSYRCAAGIRMQAMGNPNMIGCIGYGSSGTKQKFLGFTNAEIQEAGGSMNLTIEQAKSKLVELNDNVEEGYGISAWANCGRQTFIACEGWAGSGSNSIGLHVIDQAKPKIIGGVYGKQDISCLTPFRKDAGQKYMTFFPSEDKLSYFVAYEVNTVSVTIVKADETNKVGYKFYLETVESNPKKIVDGENMYGATSILNCSINPIKVDAGVKLRAYIKDENGNMVTLTDDSDPTKCSIWVCEIIRYAADGIKGVYIGDNAEPEILGARINGNLNIETNKSSYMVQDCLIEEAINTNKTNLKVFDCSVGGDVSPDVTFASKFAINGSSNYKMVVE